jgi:hypothetical protein
MGLLDDAIREHLELKRRRGANPEEVAREQREALDAAAERRVASPGADDADPAAAAPLGTAIGSPEIEGAGASGAEDPAVGSAPLQTPRSADAGETAELDMSSVLGGHDAQDQSGPPADADVDEQSRSSARPVPARPTAEDDSLEWEVPGEPAEEEAENPAEDVLEETPDFLRDTPEQDRLWFEQRPPRDFDFDK